MFGHGHSHGGGGGRGKDDGHGHAHEADCKKDGCLTCGPHAITQLAGQHAMVARLNARELDMFIQCGQIQPLKRTNGRSLLHTAAEFGKVDNVKALVTAGADVNEFTDDGLTPLHLAAKFGHEDVVDYLVAAGADVHAQAKTTSGAMVVGQMLGITSGRTPADLAKMMALSTTATRSLKENAKKVHEKLDVLTCGDVAPRRSIASNQPPIPIPCDTCNLPCVVM
eukprot:m.25424 g.25424  ORF g.25424 m.25424 type:complete len:224 (-) comp8708_c0_seq1:248-919(-)